MVTITQKTQAWLHKNDPLHASLWHSNWLAARIFTLYTISEKGMQSLVCSLVLSLVVLVGAMMNWTVALLSFAAILCAPKGHPSCPL